MAEETEATIRLTVTDQHGTVLDTVELPRDEFVAAQRSALGALSVLDGLSIGAD